MANKSNKKSVSRSNKKPTLKSTLSSNNKPIKDAIEGKWKYIIAGLFAILAMAIYSPSYNYDFVYDDDAVIKNNRFVQSGIDGLGEIWSTSYFQGYDENMNARAFRPIPLTTLALEVEVFGINQTVHHTMNILFYGLTGFFLFLFLIKLYRKQHIVLAITTVLLFILHPIHLEVVANIKSRDTMLGFLGLTIACWLLLKYIDSKKAAILVGSIFFYGVALFSKEEVITSLATIPLMLWFFRDLKKRKIAFYLLPYIGAVVLFLIYRSNILGGLNEGVPLTILDNSLLAVNSLNERIASNILILGHYLLKTVFPHPLISDYSYSTIPNVNWDDWRVYLSLIANIGLLWVGIKGLVNRKIYGFGPLFYFTSVSIFTSIVVTNVSAYNDRFLYVPVLGMCFLIAYGLQLIVKNRKERFEQINPIGFAKTHFTLIAILLILTTLAIAKVETHLPYWKDRYALFEHDIKIAPNNARMRKNYGGSFARLAVENQTSDPQKAHEYARLAIKQLKQALLVYERMGTGHIHLGNMYIILGEYDNAVNALLNAIGLDPNNYYAKASLGNVYFRKRQYQESINIIESIPVHLRNSSDWDVMARCYEGLGNSAKAAEMRSKM